VTAAPPHLVIGAAPAGCHRKAALAAARRAPGAVGVDPPRGFVL